MTFNANDIVTVLTALGILATVIGGLIVNIIVAKKNALITQETKVKVEEVVEKTEGQTKQLDNIEILVDGRYSAVLQELADVKKLLAQSTGLAHHSENAEIAQTVANEQETRVDKLMNAKQHGHPLDNKVNVPITGEIPLGPIHDTPLTDENYNKRKK